MSFQDDLLRLRGAFDTDLSSATDRAALEDVRGKYFGRKSAFQELLRTLKDVPELDRKVAGASANAAKSDMEQALGEREHAEDAKRFAHLAAQEQIDITLPGFSLPQGHLHPTTTAIRDIAAIFTRLGFTRVRHPEVDWEWYAFESLRVGVDHPARDNWETFFLEAPAHPKFGRMILTPHTTNGDVREMERGERPIRTMNINRTYRRQSDASHVPMFHQFEGLWLDQGITLAHLKGVLDVFTKEFFGPTRAVRLRPHHFRFTEPSFEVDISCGACDAGRSAGCKLCKDGWVELGGAGLLHPDVLKNGGVDPESSTALAFGWGVERVAAMRSGIQIADLRVLYKNDVRFLSQF